MQFFSRRHFLVTFWSPLLLILVYFTFLTNSKSHHIRHFRDRFKRQQGAHLFLPGSYVTNGDDPDAGPWLEWAAPSGCSRTCGGGVSTQERRCTPGYTCQGPTKRYFSCNTQDCPDIADFRAQQCSKYDSIPFEGANYQWIPYTKAPNPCELNCMPRGERFYYRHSLQVVDGTKCDDEKLDVCVEGQCQPVGCDMMLGSNAKEDKCRICDGDGSTCNTISGHLDMQDLQVGYNDILLIPAGAVNIRVAEVKPSNNYLAIRNTTGYYHLNGNWRIDFPRTLEFAGSKFHYDRYPQGFSAPDSISCTGPIDEALFIVLLFQDVNVGIDYEYSVPKTVQHVTDTETYAWTFDEFTQCTVTCGGGYQYRNVTCAGRKSLEPVDPNLCDLNNKPVDSQRCGEAPCEPRWVAKAWEKCSVPCGEGGQQTRQIYCEQIISSGVPSIVDDKQCSNIEKPPSKQPCNQGVICASWHTGPWKPCNRLCGKGKEVRRVTCFRKIDGRIQVFDDSECISKKPESERSCNIRPCEGVDWVTSEWTGCENKCGLIEETRRVQCATSKGEVYPDALCEESEARPETVRKCQSISAGCEHEWYASQWSECSAKCGSGVQTRKVFCALVTDDGFKKVEEGKCDPKKKYDATKNCTGALEVCGGEWFTGPWSKCDKQCGGGVKMRKVICMKENLKVPVSECDADSIPLGSEECNKQACDDDELLPVEVAKPVTLTSKATEPSIELFTDEYEIMEDDECEDGEWIDLEGPPAKPGPKKEKLIALVQSPLGASTDSDKESTESTWISEDLMLSDSTYADDTRTTDVFTSEVGSGDEEFTKVTASARGFSFTPLEGSGDTEITITDADYTDYSDYTVEGSGDLTTIEGVSSSTEVSEVFSKSRAFTVGATSASTEPSTVITKETDLTTEEGSGEGEEAEVTEKIEATSSQVSAETSESASVSGEEVVTTTSGEIPTTPGVSEESSSASFEITELSTEEEEETSTEVRLNLTSDVSAEIISVAIESTEKVSTVELSTDKESTVEISTGSTAEAEETTGSTAEAEETTGSTVEVSTESTPEVSTDSTAKVSIDSTVQVSTESTVEVSTESTVEVSTGSTVEVSSESTVEVSTESTVKVSTESTVEVSSESTVEVSTESTIEVSTASTVEEVSTTQISDQETSSTESGISAETSEGSSPASKAPDATTDSTVYIGESDVGIDETAKPEKPSGATTEKDASLSSEGIEITTEYSVETTSIAEKESPLTTVSEVSSTTEPVGVTGISSTSEVSVTTETALGSTEWEPEAATTEASTEAATTLGAEASTEAPTTLAAEESTEAATTLAAGVSTEAAPALPPVSSSSEVASTELPPISVSGEVEVSTEEEPEFTVSEEFTTILKAKETAIFRSTTEPPTELTTEYEVESTTEIEESTEFLPLFTGISGFTPIAGRRIDIWKPTTEAGVTDGVEWGVSDVIDIFKTSAKKCKRKKKPSCKRTTFGCCPDKVTPAQGPFDKGCPMPKTCDETTFGCCEDGVSPAEGPGFKGCPPSTCEQTLFGCCQDQKTPAEGNDKEGCPPECLYSEFGCCKDNVTEAQGPNEDGCEPEEIVTTEEVFTTTEREDCTISKFGCCPDGISVAEGEYFKGCDIFKDNCQESYYKCCPDNKTSAEGPNYLGCKTECSTNPYGCCDDNITPAHGYNKEGCCLSTAYGCCPDNINAAEGPNLEGCGCQYSPFRCCPDNITAARGYNYEGCGCQHTQYGCCPDNYTPSAGANYTGCACHTYQFGCCPDGVTVARGPHQQGCGCRNTEFGCCTDDETPATGPNHAGCTCESSEFGCCLDGETTAKGENYEECAEVPENLQASCSLTKERGTCRNYTVKWFYDMEYGGCSRFWYGGCDGNTNRFKSKEECQGVCVEPQGKDRCNLPQVSGPCEGYYPHWFYDKDRNHCAQFIYGGCLGNNNKFQSAEECNTLCVKDRNIDACEQPKEEGPCRGNFAKWYYDKESSSCQQFRYGGCKGNNNNFPTESACKQKCAQAGRKKEYCSLPRAQGNCIERLPRWYYDASEKRCMPFYYSGCEGNNNNFVSQYHCELDCPNEVVKETCQLAAEVGDCSNYTDRWYYDTTEKTCRQFYYGGCGGNKNNFATEQACQRHCDGLKVAADLTTAAPPEIEEPFKVEFCFLPSETGPCRMSEARWFYDKDGVCKQFLYGGCQGNRNNFKSSEDCRQVCGNAQDICTLPKVVGPCDAEYEQWYYNQSTDACESFKYGGCWGNDNRFSDQLTCEQKCKRGPLSVTSAPKALTEQVPSEISICYNTVDAGTCNDSIPAFYYDPRSQKCATFIYSGCGGNANRYNSEEQCERQCGRFRGQDVCSLPRDVGPCDGYFVKAFYNVEIGKCEEFAFGGCEGNGNRFSSVEECESICVTHEERKPSEPHSAICQLPVDVGPCAGGSHKRWYFDDSRGECIAFIYTGCGGNFNRFKSFQACVDACREYMVRTEAPNEVDSTLGEDAHPCQSFADECAALLCPYGIEAYVDESLCNKCKCHDPCAKHDCSNGTQCAIDPNRNRTSAQDPNFVAVCRETNKPGECPPLRADEEHCEEECKNDADCALDLKCCSTGCGTACVVPVAATEYPPAALITTSYLPAFTESPVQAGLSPPELDEEEYKPVVQAGEGDFVVLKCAVRGNPAPKITWTKDNVLIDGLEPRYRLLLSGALRIVSLYKSDSGIYLCTADNKIGQPLQKEVKLEVLEPQNHPARILDIEVPPNVVVALGSPTILSCFAYGYPTPAITWWKEDNMIPLKTPEFTVQKDFSLQIHSVRLHNLGIYTCQAYNGYGKAASWAVTVQALGPVYSTNPNDKKYMKYVVDAPEKPTTAARPQYPYRPSRVSTTPSPPRSPLHYYRTSPHYFVTTPTPTPKHTPPTFPTSPPTTVTSTTTSTSTSTLPSTFESTPSTTPAVQSSPVYSVPVKANITLSNYIYPIGSDVSIPCDVDGYPIPEVQWYKDGQLILPSPSVLIVTESHRLILQKVSQSDSGEYRCEAWNQFSRSTSTTPLVIEGRVIHPNCTDNPYFANCELIVKAKYCTHKYYARFCCRSCTEAGLLPSYGPHLQDEDKQSALRSNLV